MDFDVLLANRLRYGGPRRRFLLRDVRRDPLPRADLVLCRDALNHFSDEDLMTALRAIIASGSRYLLASTFIAREKNDPIAIGDWRPVNLQLPPLSLPAPVDALIETPPETGYDDKRLALWGSSRAAKRLTRPTHHQPIGDYGTPTARKDRSRRTRVGRNSDVVGAKVANSCAIDSSRNSSDHRRRHLCKSGLSIATPIFAQPITARCSIVRAKQLVTQGPCPNGTDKRTSVRPGQSLAR